VLSHRLEYITAAEYTDSVQFDELLPEQYTLSRQQHKLKENNEVLKDMT
jgi:hypothetical protein